MAAKDHPKNRHVETDVTIRRRKVASLLLAGIEQQILIAAEVGASKATISRDVKAIEEEWREAVVQDIHAAKGRVLKRIERMIQAVWTQAASGDLGAIKRVIELMDRRAKILGLDAPKRTEITGKDGGAMQHEHAGLSEEDIARAERYAERKGLQVEDVLAMAMEHVKNAQR